MSITTERVRHFATKHLEKLLSGGFQGRFFLAGGCFKSLLHGKPPNDLDLWPASPEDRTLLLDSLQAQGCDILEHNQFNTVLKNPVVPYRIEVTCKCPSSLEESVADFDIQLACVAAEYSNGSVKNVYIHAGVADCILSKQVRAVSRLRPMLYSLLTLERLDRYGAKLEFGVCEKSKRRVWDIYTAASEQGRNDLLEAAGLRFEDVPKYAAIQRVFLDGRPSEACRPFTIPELNALRLELVSNKKISDDTCSSSRSPMAVFVMGLPGAGKGTVLEEVLMALGLSLKTMANLDMDHIRSFHGQFSHYIRGEAVGDGPCTSIYKDLVPWFNEGSNAEQILYKDKNSIVRDILANRCDFVLPVHSLESLEFIEYTTSLGYVPLFIEVRVPIEVALERAVPRAKVTGRYTSPDFIQESANVMVKLLSSLKEWCVMKKSGRMVLFDNSREGGGGRCVTVTNITLERLPDDSNCTYGEGYS